MFDSALFSLGSIAGRSKRAALFLAANGAAAQAPNDAQIASIVVTYIANLKKLSGAAFDKAYIDNEVRYHQQVIDK